MHQHLVHNIRDAAVSWQIERNADPEYAVTAKEAALFAATLGPFMLRPPTTDQVRELLDLTGALLDLGDLDQKHPAVRSQKRILESQVINAAWRVGGEMP